MSHSRRSRPTLRLLTTDLDSGWSSPVAQRVLFSARFDDLHPLSELPHPIIAKAAESISNDEQADNTQGLIKSSNEIPLFEIKVQQWRGAVWKDPTTGVHWLIKAGLAKGDHKDSDDFYQQIERAAKADTITQWFPNDDDFRLLRQETAARIITEWELHIQNEVEAALHKVSRGGQTRIDVCHPVKKSARLAQLILEVTEVRDEGYEADEILVIVSSGDGFQASQLEWQMITRTLISLHPPVQAWDRYQNQFATIAEPGTWTKRTDDLSALNSRGELAEPEPGTHSHYSHHPHIAGSTIHGTGIRALCGVFFVAHQDPETMPVCPECKDRWNRLPERD